MPGSGRSRAGFRAASLVLGILLALALGEGLIRLAGRGAADGTRRPNEPTMHEPDPVLGWRAVEGSYEVPPYTPGGPTVRLTFHADGSRTAGGLTPGGRRSLVFVGGSFTQGWAISDEETLAWRAQRVLPDWKVSNFGTAGYGTLQSLLVLERLLASPTPPDAVVYGFIGHHEVRNVAAGSWLRVRANRPARGFVAAPYCTLDPGGGLVRHPPEAPTVWAMRDRLELVKFLEGAYTDLRARGRAEQARSATEQLIVEMDRLVRSRGARFAVVFLGFHRKGTFAHYRSFLEDRGIAFANCAFPVTPEMQVAGEGHPNGAMNARWLKCLSEKWADWPGR